MNRRNSVEPARVFPTQERLRVLPDCKTEKGDIVKLWEDKPFELAVIAVVILLMFAGAWHFEKSKREVSSLKAQLQQSRALDTGTFQWGDTGTPTNYSEIRWETSSKDSYYWGFGACSTYESEKFRLHSCDCKFNTTAPCEAACFGCEKVSK